MTWVECKPRARGSACPPAGVSAIATKNGLCVHIGVDACKRAGIEVGDRLSLDVDVSLGAGRARRADVGWRIKRRASGCLSIRAGFGCIPAALQGSASVEVAQCGRGWVQFPLPLKPRRDEAQVIDREAAAAASVDPIDRHKASIDALDRARFNARLKARAR